MKRSLWITWQKDSTGILGEHPKAFSWHSNALKNPGGWKDDHFLGPAHAGKCWSLLIVAIFASSLRKFVHIALNKTFPRLLSSLNVSLLKSMSIWESRDFEAAAFCRLYFVGFRKDVACNNFKWPEAPTRNTCLKDRDGGPGNWKMRVWQTLLAEKKETIHDYFLPKTDSLPVKTQVFFSQRDIYDIYIYSSQNEWMSPYKRDPFKRKGSFSKHHLSGASC